MKRRQLALARVLAGKKEKASDCCGRGGASTNRTELMDVELSVPCKGETSKELVIEGPDAQSKHHRDASHWALAAVACVSSVVLRVQVKIFVR